MPSLKEIFANKQLFIVFAMVVILFCGIYSYYALHVSSRDVSQTNTIHPSTTIQPPPPQNSDQTTQNSSLLSNDEPAKQSLLMRFLHSDSQSGVVYKSASVQIEYVAGDDVFQAEILTPQVTAAKNEAEMWFHMQGITQKDICTLPLIFYLNGPVKENLPDNGSQVNLLPDGC